MTILRKGITIKTGKTVKLKYILICLLFVLICRICSSGKIVTLLPEMHLVTNSQEKEVSYAPVDLTGNFAPYKQFEIIMPDNLEANVNNAISPIRMNFLDGHGYFDIFIRSQTLNPHYGLSIQLSDNFWTDVERTSGTLKSFGAVAGRGTVRLTWETSLEICNAGFNILRSKTELGRYVKINNTLIPSHAVETKGAVYKLADNKVINGKTYYYKLQDVTFDGRSNLHGPVSISPGLIYGIIK